LYQRRGPRRRNGAPGAAAGANRVPSMTPPGPADPDPAVDGDDVDSGDLDLADLDAPLPLADASAGVRHFLVGTDGNGTRLDKYLAAQMPEVSRSRLQRWIEDDAVRLNGAAARTRASVFAGDRIEVQEAPAEHSLAYGPEPIPITVVWEDETILVIDKPAGLVVHPGAGNWSGTLLNGLLAHDPRLSKVPRAGIVHRLDAGTSGLMVVARTPSAQLDLVRQLQARTVVREYWALASGMVAPSICIDAPLGRDPRNPLRFRVSAAPNARPARTFVRRLASWTLPGGKGSVSWLACRLDTGRTHQIRVHLESLSHPLLGDPVYRRHLPAQLLAEALPGHGLDRQALHACRLELIHPAMRRSMAWSRSPPQDLRALLLHLGARPEQLRPPAQGYFPDRAGIIDTPEGEA
jgi:23S rRNA pseudouridine1911/1915/1917 synthase